MGVLVEAKYYEERNHERFYFNFIFDHVESRWCNKGSVITYSMDYIDDGYEFAVAFWPENEEPVPFVLLGLLVPNRRRGNTFIPRVTKQIEVMPAREMKKRFPRYYGLINESVIDYRKGYTQYPKYGSEVGICDF